MEKKRTGSSPTLQPFLKWAGGKRKVVPELEKHIPDDFGTYFEPFVGGGALFFSLAGRPTGPPFRRAVLADNNKRLIRTYRAVRDRVDPLIELLLEYKSRHDKDFYYKVRAQDIDRKRDDTSVGAWLIYLNKTAFNGLYRVNSRNGFNVPIGSYANPDICNEQRLRDCSRALRGVDLLHGSFQVVLKLAKPGDLVYFDPPYVPLNDTARFTAYTRGGFGADAQELLRDVALELKRRGVTVILSNHDTPLVRELYARDFTLRTIRVGRAINSKGSARGPVSEVVIT